MATCDMDLRHKSVGSLLIWLCIPDVGTMKFGKIIGAHHI